MRTILRSTGSLIIVTALLAACAGDSVDSADDGNADPLTELFGWSDNRSPAEQRALQLRSEEAVQACMRAEGFDYTPVDQSAQVDIVSDDEAELFNDPVAYGEKYGYGIVQNYERYEAANFDADGNLAAQAFDDPNQEYVDSLSERERDDYYRALSGDQTQIPDDEDGVFTAPSLEEQGCYGQAQAEVYGDRFTIDPEVEARLSDFFLDMMNNPDLQAAYSDWKACMLDEDSNVFDAPVEGFVVNQPDQMYQLLEFEKSTAMGMVIIDYQQSPDGGSSYGVEGEQTPLTDEEIDRLLERELSLWKLDHRCQEDSDITGIQQRAQQQLVDELKTEFPELGQRDT